MNQSYKYGCNIHLYVDKGQNIYLLIVFLLFLIFEVVVCTADLQIYVTSSLLLQAKAARINREEIVPWCIIRMCSFTLGLCSVQERLGTCHLINLLLQAKDLLHELQFYSLQLYKMLQVVVILRAPM